MISQEREESAQILVVQHSELAHGGHFCKTIEEQGGVITLCKPLHGDILPDAWHSFDGLVVLGGPQHATDDDEAPHFPDLMQLMLDFDLANKPVAGICLGCQLLARAHGRNPRRLGFLEIGFVQHSLTEAGQFDQLLNGELPPLMEFHEDTFDLPEGATLLIAGDRCKNQCFKVGRASYGFQVHLEVNEELAKSWLDLFSRGEISSYRRYLEEFTSAQLAELSENIESKTAASAKFCRQIAQRWLALVDQNRAADKQEMTGDN